MGSTSLTVDSGVRADEPCLAQLSDFGSVPSSFVLGSLAFSANFSNVALQFTEDISVSWTIISQSPLTITGARAVRCTSSVPCSFIFTIRGSGSLLLDTISFYETAITIAGTAATPGASATIRAAYIQSTTAQALRSTFNPSISIVDSHFSIGSSTFLLGNYIGANITLQNVTGTISVDQLYDIGPTDTETLDFRIMASRLVITTRNVVAPSKDIVADFIVADSSVTFLVRGLFMNCAKESALRVERSNVTFSNPSAPTPSIVPFDCILEAIDSQMTTVGLANRKNTRLRTSGNTRFLDCPAVFDSNSPLKVDSGTTTFTATDASVAATVTQLIIQPIEVSPGATLQLIGSKDADTAPTIAPRLIVAHSTSIGGDKTNMSGPPCTIIAGAIVLNDTNSALHSSCSLVIEKSTSGIGSISGLEGSAGLTLYGLQDNTTRIST